MNVFGGRSGFPCDSHIFSDKTLHNLLYEIKLDIGKKLRYYKIEVLEKEIKMIFAKHSYLNTNGHHWHWWHSNSNRRVCAR